MLKNLNTTNKQNPKHFSLLKLWVAILKKPKKTTKQSMFDSAC